MKSWAMLLAALLLVGCKGEGPATVVDLDEEILDKYLQAYLVIGPAYRKAYAAGASPAAIPRRDDIQGALDEAGWSWAEYQSVHGSVSNALLFLEDPEAFRQLELGSSDAPEANVALVQARYFDVKQARLIVEETVYR